MYNHAVIRVGKGRYLPLKAWSHECTCSIVPLIGQRKWLLTHEKWMTLTKEKVTRTNNTNYAKRWHSFVIRRLMRHSCDQALSDKQLGRLTVHLILFDVTLHSWRKKLCDNLHWVINFNSCKLILQRKVHRGQRWVYTVQIKKWSKLHNEMIFQRITYLLNSKSFWPIKCGTLYEQSENFTRAWSVLNPVHLRMKNYYSK